jgi:hypothetical protein
MKTIWRGMVLFAVLGGAALLGGGCGGDDNRAPCGMGFCADDEICCISPGKEAQCVKGNSCP